MGRKAKHIKNLTEEQKSSLKKGYTYGKSPLYRRKCHCILLSHDGKTPQDLSTFFGISVHSIREWLKLWEKNESVDDLKLKEGRGRRPKLKTDDETHVQTVKTLIKNEPRNLNRVKAQLKDNLGIIVSTKTLKRFLKNLNTVGNALGEG